MIEEFGEWEEPSFDAYTDEQVISIIREGDTEALDYLIKKYLPTVRIKGRTYFIMGGDREDIIQEGMIGLYQAIRDFKEERLSSFKSFAELCITRQIITAIKTATRQKHIPLNSSVSLERSATNEENDRTILELLAGSSLDDPEQLIIYREKVDHLQIKLQRNLSSLEKDVLALYIEGQNYLEIALTLDRPAKSIDNALQRIKKKIELYLGSH